MPKLTIQRSSPVLTSARVLQASGIFDIPPTQKTEERWDVDFEFPETWNVGLIVGPSGAGKSTVARELFPGEIVSGWDWPDGKSLLDGFPAGMSIKDITALLSSVGFSSPPAWLRPFCVLSNGEQFRVNMARTLAEMPELAVVDEFTSVVDRTVAQIGSAAIAKAVRKRGQQFVAVTCHYDVMEWLEPDWVFQPHTGEFLSGRRLRRPEIPLEIRRVHHSAWQLFRKHHYLDANVNPAAACFVAFWNGVPVAFNAALTFPHPTVRNMKRSHRTVCLPDYQGVGIGMALADYLGAMYRGMGYRFTAQTAHPSLIQARNRSPKWKMVLAPKMRSAPGKSSSLAWKPATQRLVASFEYIGSALDKDEALRVYNGR